GIEAQLAWTPPTLLGLEVQSLALAFQRLLDLRAKENGNGAELLPMARISVGERIAEITGLLSERLSVLLSEVVENERSRQVIIVTFLAVLEMWKRERIAVKQEALIGPMVLARGTGWEQYIKEDELEAQLVQARQEATENWNKFLRERADTENFRKRQERVLTDRVQHQKKALLQKLLGVMDNAERALIFQDTLDRQGLQQALRMVQ